MSFDLGRDGLDHGIEIEPGQFDNCHKGKRAWVFGTGPSLKNITDPQWEIIDSEISIGCGNIAAFHDMQYLAVGELHYDDDGELWPSATESKAEYKFVVEGPQKIMPYPNVRYRRLQHPGATLDEGLMMWKTSAHACLNLAIIMGCNPIILLGIDYRENAHVIPQANDSEGRGFCSLRFTSDDWTEEDNRKNFDRFLPLAEERKIIILNGNPDSAVDCFDKVKLGNYLGVCKAIL